MPSFLSETDALLVHSRVLSLHGGREGVRDAGLLASALAQPGTELFGEFLHPDVPAQAATYLYHLARNHPFVDGNKRTALVCALLRLDLHGLALNLNGDERFALVLDVAAGSLAKEEVIRLFRQRVTSR